MGELGQAIALQEQLHCKMPREAPVAQPIRMMPRLLLFSHRHSLQNKNGVRGLPVAEILPDVRGNWLLGSSCPSICLVTIPRRLHRYLRRSRGCSFRHRGLLLAGCRNLCPGQECSVSTRQSLRSGQLPLCVHAVSWTRQGRKIQSQGRGRRSQGGRPLSGGPSSGTGNSLNVSMVSPRTNSRSSSVMP